MNRSQSAIIIVILLIVSAGTFYTFVWNEVDEMINPYEPQEEVLDGERRQYYKDGRLRTVINHDKGVKHGKSTMFHTDGETILLSISYQKGRREGVSKKYYQTGELYAETSYRNDLLDGQRKVYYRSGQVKSIVNYYQGHPGVGTEEFLTSGKRKPMLKIIQKRRDNDIEFTTSDHCEDTRFYVGSLVEDRFLDAMSDDVRELPKGRGVHYLNKPKVPKASNLMIICSCESSQGNPVIITDSISL